MTNYEFQKTIKKIEPNAFRSGFTIVELLVVIVAIGILASITVVSYSGISIKAKEASLQSDLKNAATVIELDKTASPTNSYPSSIGVANGGKGLTASNGNTFDYKYNTTTNTFILTDSNNSLSYYVASDMAVPSLVASFVSALGGNNFDSGSSVILTSDGGYAVAGQAGSFGAGFSDVFIAKYTSSGALSWSRTWGGGQSDEGNSIVQASDGGYVIIGSTKSYSASFDMFIAKYTSDGTLSWSKTWGGTGDDSGSDIATNSDGGYVVTGSTRSYGAGGDDMFIVKYTPDGTIIWNKTLGGSDWDEGSSIVVASDGGYVVTGETDSYGAGGDMFIAKYASDGTLSWSKTWGGTGYDSGSDIATTSDGGYVVTGSLGDYDTGISDAFIAKYTSDGTLSWNKTWGGSDDDFGYSIVQASDGGYAVTGETSNFDVGITDMFISKYTSDGTLSWSRTWGGGGPDYGDSIIRASDGGFVVTGSTQSGGAGFADLFITKYLSDGTIKNCPVSMCQSPLATTTTPSVATSSFLATVATPSVTAASPSATSTTPSAISTVIVAP